jgi:hypothetical protein
VHVWAPGATVNVLPEAGKLQIDIPADLPSDQLWLRLYNDEGCSALVPFLVGGLAELLETEPNNSRDNPQSLPACGVTVNGVLQESDDVDAFALELQAGQTLVAALDANTRLGAPMDAMLQVTSADGTVLAANHDALGLDPRIIYTASDSGVHLVRVFAFPAEPDTNIRYRGGSSYIYRLTLTSGPFVMHALPLALPAEERQVGAAGWNLAAAAELPVVLPGETEFGRLLPEEAARDVRVCPEAGLGFVHAAGWGGAAYVRIVPHASATETVDDSTDRPTCLAPPSTLTGCLRVPGERDEYRVALAAGQAVVIAVEAPSMYLPTAPLLHLIDPAGQGRRDHPHGRR